jgi:hypothetical protein
MVHNCSHIDSKLSRVYEMQAEECEDQTAPSPQ